MILAGSGGLSAKVNYGNNWAVAIDDPSIYLVPWELGYGEIMAVLAQLGYNPPEPNSN